MSDKNRDFFNLYYQSVQSQKKAEEKKKKEKKKEEEKKYDQPWYLDVAHFLSRPLYGVAGATADYLESAKQAGIKARKAYENEGVSGFLSEAGKGLVDTNVAKFKGGMAGLFGDEQKTTEDVVGAMGWKQNEADGEYNWIKGRKGNAWYAPDLYDLVTFGGDIVFDPTTYVGAGALTKVGKAGAEAAIKDVAERTGVEVGKAATEKGQYEVIDKLLDDVSQSTVDKSAKIDTPYGLTKEEDILDDITRLQNERLQIVREGRQAGRSEELIKRDVNWIDDAISEHTQALRDYKAVTTPINRDLVQRTYGKKIEDAIKADNLAGQNSLLSVSIPFTKYEQSLIQKPKWSGLRVDKVPISASQASAAQSMLKQSAITAEETRQIEKLIAEKPSGYKKKVKELEDAALKKQQDYLEKVYGKVVIDDLDTQEFNDLVARLSKAESRQLPNANVAEAVIDPKTGKPVFKEFSNQKGYKSKYLSDYTVKNIPRETRKILDEFDYYFNIAKENGKITPELEKFLGVSKDGIDQKYLEIVRDAVKGRGKNRGQEINQVLKDKVDVLKNQVDYQVKVSATPTAQTSVRNLDQSRFVADAGGASKVGAFLRRRNPFNARTFGSKDEAINDLAEVYVESQNKVAGRNREIDKRVANLKRLTKGLSNDQIKNIVAIVQKEFSDEILDNSTKVFEVLTKSGNVRQFTSKQEADNYAKTLEQQGVEVESVLDYTRNTQEQLANMTIALKSLKQQYDAIKKSTSKENIQKANLLKQQITDLTNEISSVRGSKTPSLKEAVLRVANGDEAVAKRLEQLARNMSVMLKEVNRADIDANDVYDARANYFPHVINYTQKDLDNFINEFGDDPQIGELLKKSTRNKFAKERKSFQTMAEVDNALFALQHQQKMFDEGTEEFATIQKKIDVLSNLYERDPFTALLKRYKKSIQTNAMRDLQKQFIDNGVIFLPDQKVPDDVAGSLVKLDDKQALALNLPTGTKMNKEVLKGISKTKQLFTSEGMQKLFENIESLTNIFKTLTTTVIPVHYFYNFIGSTANNFMAGVDLKSYKEARDLLIANKNGKLSKEQQKIINDMLDSGVLNQTSYTDFLDSIFTPKVDERGMIKKVEDWSTNNAVTNFYRNRVGDPMDNFFRVANYLDVLKKTRNPKKAADSVRKFLFNYQELTQSDRAMKIILPFWNWTKNNTPLQIEMALTAPRFFVQYQRIKEDMQGDIMNDPDIPDYIKDGYLRFGDTLYNPRLPLQDLEILSNPRKLLSSTNPIGRVPFIELPTNKKIFSDQPIDYDMHYNRTGSYFDDPMNLIKYLADQTGASSKVYKGFESTAGEKAQEKPWYQDFIELGFTGSTKSVSGFRKAAEEKRNKSKSKKEEKQRDYISPYNF